MPYIYSLAGAAWLNDYTIMRGLAMDFPTDKGVYNIGDQYLFGPALMVCPVHVYKAREREVYFPAGSGWYDFYSGKYSEGGLTMAVPAPYERMPLFVKAGSIVPVGPEIEYTAQKPADPVTLYVYTGADASFTLYEDEGTNYNYEKGYAISPIQNKGELTIGTSGSRDAEGQTFTLYGFQRTTEDLRRIERQCGKYYGQKITMKNNLTIRYYGY
jgi:alpha-D-xyloside xylohydrolase